MWNSKNKKLLLFFMTHAVRPFQLAIDDIVVIDYSLLLKVPSVHRNVHVQIIFFSVSFLDHKMVLLCANNGRSTDSDERYKKSVEQHFNSPKLGKSPIHVSSLTKFFHLNKSNKCENNIFVRHCQNLRIFSCANGF
jgi:hypothetical protein